MVNVGTTSAGLTAAGGKIGEGSRNFQGALTIPKVLKFQHKRICLQKPSVYLLVSLSAKFSGLDRT